MKYLFSVGLLAAMMYLGCRALAGSIDSDICTRHGFEGNVLSPLLYGQCTFKSAEGTTVYYSVEMVQLHNIRSPKVFDWRKQ